jgi:nucleotide-binding universal stress UspA family protein
MKRILVPLDGSRSAEAAVPAAGLLAGVFDAEVVLLHVLERRPPASRHGQAHLAAAGEAGDYLRERAAVLLPAGIRYSIHVHDETSDDTARGIAEHELETEADLVVMAVHGGAGVSRLMHGSLAQRIITHGRSPVLLLGPGGRAFPACRRLLVPIDMQPGHAASLEPACEFALAFGAEVSLLMVVDTAASLSADKAGSARLSPAVTASVLELTAEHAREFAAETQAELGRRGVVAKAKVMRGDLERTIARLAEKEDADLVVLGTHGRAGLDAFWEGSKAARILHRLKRPVLLVPAIRIAGEK